ncbi:MAG: hypothetical protein KAH30_04930 [Caldisericia bacterium]|nr:hypothetical protein [Caldisericia bacterium]
MKHLGWISIGLGLVAILVRHVIPFLWIFTFIIAGIGFLVGVVGMTNKEDRSLSIAGVAVCIIAAITHIGSIWMLLLLGVSAYLVFFRKPKNTYDSDEQYLDE